VNIALALVPVLLFLGLLVLLDSFKLVSVRSVVLALLAGGVAALAAGWTNGVLLEATGLPAALLSRYAAPVVEESLKAAWVLALVRRGRVGFLVDAAILGFAVGAGFALVENVEYLHAMAERHALLWLARGFGTAVLHGATTSIVAILAKGFSDRHRSWPTASLLPGLLVAVSVHAAYNHFFLPPLLATAVLLTVLPLLLILVFARSERATRQWLGLGLDSDLELVDSILSGQALQTRLGDYLRTLSVRFPGEVVADMLCLVRVQAELAIRAKGLLLAREAGLEVPVGDDVSANLQELRYLERSIGPTGMLALAPILRRSSRDLWQVYLLEQARPG
jgi:RsiW-degrading membrane proteinase PrsW (M82 family)